MKHLIGAVRRHLADPDSHHRRIARDFLWVSFFVLLVKLAGAAKEMAIAWRYGVGEKVDAYVFVFYLVNWPVSVWFSVLGVLLVPLVARLRHRGPNELPRFMNELLGLTLLVAVGLGFLAWFGLPMLLRTDWLGLTPAVVAQAIDMSGGLALLAPIGVFISLFSAAMMAFGRHHNTLFEGIPAATILIVLLLPPGYVPEPLLWGTVAGFALHLAALAGPFHQRAELQTPRFGFRSPAWRGFWNSIAVLAVAQALMGFTAIIDQFFAAGLGTGALSTLSYANRILALILGMGALAIGRATLPVFSEATVRSTADVTALALRWAMLFFIVGLIMLGLFWAMSPVVAKLLFERGSFNSENTRVVSLVLQYMLIQLPFYFSGIVLHSLFSSQGRYLLILLVLSSCLAVKVMFNVLLTDALGLLGLPVATAIMYFTFCTSYLYLAASKKAVA